MLHCTINGDQFSTFDYVTIVIYKLHKKIINAPKFGLSKYVINAVWEVFFVFQGQISIGVINKRA